MQVSRISLIIPCYRDSATLARAIDSVRIQTRTVDEIIVVNDCSPETANIEQVLRAYPDVVYVKNPINLGLAATRNRGVSVAKGEVVSFLDADDELHPQKIELQSKVLRNNSAVTTGVCRVYPGEAVGHPTSYADNPVCKVVHGIGGMLFNNYLTGASIMIHKEYFSRVGGYDPNLRSCEDFDLWLRLIDAGITVCNVPLPLYIYHYNVEGLSRNYFNISYWELEVIKKYFSACKREGGVNQAKYVFAFWLVKHFTRAQMSNDVRLFDATKQNLETLLADSLLLRLGIKMLQKTQLLKLYALLRSVSRT